MNISIVLPIYNVEEYIRPCLLSILNQTYRDFELILVDDCGQDRSMEISHELLDGQSEIPIQWLHHDYNRGLSAARNTGLVAAQGKYIYFIDSDDFIAPNSLTLLYAQAEKYDADFTVGDFDVQGDATYVPRLHVKDDCLKGIDILHSYLHQQFYMMAWNKLIKRSFLIQHDISFIEGLLHEDEPWSFLIACEAQTVAFLHEPVYIYRIRPNSIQTDKNFTHHFDAYSRIFQYIAKTAIARGIEHDDAFLNWFERRKSILFKKTETCGSKEQMWQLYQFIYNSNPIKHFDKIHVHYLVPMRIGFLLYKRFYKHILC